MLGPTRGRKSYDVLWICNQRFGNLGRVVDDKQCTSGHLNCQKSAFGTSIIIIATVANCPSYNIRTQRGVKRQCILTYIFSYKGEVC